MKKKVLVTLLLCIALVATVILFLIFHEKPEEIVPVETTQEDPNITHIIMTYLYLDGTKLEGLPEVVEAINDITREEIGVEVELKVENVLSSFTDYPLWISQGERLDLMLINYQDITTYIDQGMLQDVDRYLEKYAPEIQALIEDGSHLLGAATIKNRSYGVNVISRNTGSGGGLWIPTRYLEEINFSYDATHVYTTEELDQLFAALKEKYPDSYPLGQITANNTYSTYGFFNPSMESLGAEANSGYLSEDGEILDFFENPDYYRFLRKMKEWQEKGYIYPDSSFTNASATELLKAGTILSIPLSSSPGMYNEENCGEKMTCLLTTPVIEGRPSTHGVFWTIPSTAGEPEAATKFLNLMYSDSRIVNLLQYGLEGRDYEITNQEQGIIRLKEDGTYTNAMGLYGNQKLVYFLGSEEEKKQSEVYEELVQYRELIYPEFTFLSELVSVELTKVQEVVNRYVPVLESGMGDLEAEYGEFIQELKNAGLDAILAEKQRQLDEYLERHPEEAESQQEESETSLEETSK